MERKLVMVALLVAVIGWAGTAAAQNVGDKGKAIWHGKEYPAEIAKKSGSRCFIHWIGEDGSWDEWQDCSGFKRDSGKVAADPSGGKFGVGDAVKVLWKGTWYDASVLAVSGKKGTYKIHYDGYDTSWDEWVGNDRIKGR